MAKRWIALLILCGACQPQPAARSPGEQSIPGDQAPWWCAYATDGFSSNCERAHAECDRKRDRRSQRTEDCNPEQVAYCFRYVNKGRAIIEAVVLACSAQSTHCEDRRANITEAFGNARVVSECEAVK
jgi:hypothetical protein